MHNCIYLYVGLVMPHLRLSSTRNQESSRSMLSKCERERERATKMVRTNMNLMERAGMG